MDKRVGEQRKRPPRLANPLRLPRDLRTMYSTTTTTTTPSLSPVSNSPSRRSSMPLILRIVCTSSPIPPHNLHSKPVNLNPSTQKPISDLRLPLPAPDLHSDMKEKIVSLELMGIDAGQILCRNPDLRQASLSSIHQIIYFLQSKGIRQKDLPRIFGMCPQLITANIKKDLAPVFDFLSKDLEVPDSNFYRVIRKCPRILATNVRDQLKPTLFYLQRLGLKDKLHREPVLLVLSVEKTIIPKLEFLTSLGLSREEAIILVNRSPDLLTFSIENNFKPKSEYYFRDMMGSLDELKEFPQYFAFSLEQRIKPRHRELVEKRIEMPLAVMLKSMDAEFIELVQQLVRDCQTEIGGVGSMYTAS